MTIAGGDRFPEVVALRNRRNHLFQGLNTEQAPVTAASFVPAVDIYEDQDTQE
jgi:hypothetical protein